MQTIRNKFFLLAVVLLTSATFAFAQNENQAAVDTLTKDVAVAVFEKINQPKAQEIYTQLLNCGAGCDPQQVIRDVGSWDQVGQKMQELSELKNTASFIAMSPEAANAAIRKQLAQFYARYKNDNNYGKPLSPAVQAKMLAKIDQLLPPAVAPEPAPAVSGSPAVSQTIAGNETSIDPVALQISQLENRAKKAEAKQMWMMIVGGIIGLLVGAGAVYLLLYRALKNEVNRLTDENTKLSLLNDSLRTKPTNEIRQPQADIRQKAADYDAIVRELGADKPLTAIRQMKQQLSNGGSAMSMGMRSEKMAAEPVIVPEPEPVQLQMQPISPEPDPQPARSEVFYFPPPDPTGQFDGAQKTSALSPESAYRFSVDAATPTVAQFRFEAEPGRLARFLTYRNYMIEPACESENSYTTAYTRIAMRRDGEAVLDNGVWRVKTKALIRYE